MGLGQVFAVRSLALKQVGYGVEAQTVDPHGEPKIHYIEHRLAHGWVIKIQIRLMTIKTVPVICLRQRIPSPIGKLKILKDDARIRIFICRIAPYIEVAFATSWRSPARALEPRMLVRSMIKNEFRNHKQTAPMRLFEERAEFM